jgi:hypothetical protein
VTLTPSVRSLARTGNALLLREPTPGNRDLSHQARYPGPFRRIRTSRAGRLVSGLRVSISIG